MAIKIKKDIKNEIYASALENAIKYDGKATAGAIVGKILGKYEALRKEPSLHKEITKIVEEVNKLSLDEQKQKLGEFGPREHKEHKKREGLKELPDVDKRQKVIMRFEPSPSGPLHIGHAYVLSLNYEYAKKYGGDMILRIGDTNPDNVFEDSYILIPEDAQWLCEGQIKQIALQSERMELYYQYTLRLIEEGFAYVCTCDSEDFKESMDEQVECPCRSLSSEEHLLRWEKMLDFLKGYATGEAVVRFKTDIKNPNPAMRDFPLLRVNETPHVHVGRKYRIWPLMNFSVGVDDADMCISHTLRGKDHADNAKRQAMMHEALQVHTPIAISVGRINFTGFEVSCSKTRPLIEDGTYTGWDDPRIPFLKALRRRGYQPGALRRYAVEVGVTRNDKTVSMEEFFKTIDSFNKQILDPIAYRYFFVSEPKKVVIKNAPASKVELDLHPDNKQGGRVFETGSEFYVASDDYEELMEMPEGSLFRLMDCLNFRREGKEFVFVSSAYEDYKDKGKKIIHWLPVSDDLMKVNVLMPDAKAVSGFGENTLASVKEGTSLQLERFGFVRLDSKDKEGLSFYYTHA